MFYSCKIVPQGDTDKNDKSSKKMAVKVKYATALYHKINAYILHGKFRAFSESAHILDYAALLILVIFLGTK